MRALEVVVKFNADFKKFENETKKMMKSINRLSNDLKDMSKTISATLVSPIVESSVAIATFSKDFEVAMAKMNMITEQIGLTFTEMIQQMLHIGAISQISSEIAMEAMQTLSQAGLETNEMLENLNEWLVYIHESGLGLESAMNQITEAISSFNEELNESVALLQGLATSLAAATIGIQSLIQAAQELTPFTEELGDVLEILCSALSCITNSGINVLDTFNQLIEVFTNLQAFTEVVKQQFIEFGLAIIQSDSKLKSFYDTVMDVSEAYKTLIEVGKENVLSLLFGEEAMESARTMIESLKESYAKLSEEMDTNEEKTLKASDLYGGDFIDKLKDLDKSFEETSNRIDEILQPALDLLVDLGINASEAFNNLPPELQELIVAVGTAGIGMIEFMGIVGDLGKTIEGFQKGLKLLEMAFTSGLGPVTLLIAALAAIAAVIIYWDEIVEFFKEVFEVISELFTEGWEFIKDICIEIWEAIADFFVELWDRISETIREVWEAVADFFTELWERISGTVREVWEAVAEFFSELWERISGTVREVWEAVAGFFTELWERISGRIREVWEAVAGFFAELWERISGTVREVWEAVAGFFTELWERISGRIREVWETVAEFFSSMWDRITNIFETVLNFIRDIIQEAWDFISNITSNIWEGITSFLSNLWEGIKRTASGIWEGLKNVIMTPVESIRDTLTKVFTNMKDNVLGIWDSIKSGLKKGINFIIKPINKFINGINSMSSKVNKIPGVSIPEIPNIPELAKGGHLFGSGIAIVGEAGPELLMKSGTGVSVTPLSSHEKAAGIGGALGTSGINITIQSMSVQNQSDIYKVSRQLNALIQRSERSRGVR